MNAIVATAPAARSGLGEPRSWELPGTAEILTSAFWESARPGVLFALTGERPAGPGCFESRVGSALPAVHGQRLQRPDLVRGPPQYDLI
jgi:hypothetical protein